MRFFSALVMGLVKVEAEEYTYYSIFARLYGVQNGLYFEEGGWLLCSKQGSCLWQYKCVEILPIISATRAWVKP
jgi:hypothetical protein